MLVREWPVHVLTRTGTFLEPFEHGFDLVEHPFRTFRVVLEPEVLRAPEVVTLPRQHGPQLAVLVNLVSGSGEVALVVRAGVRIDTFEVFFIQRPPGSWSPMIGMTTHLHDGGCIGIRFPVV